MPGPLKFRDLPADARRRFLEIATICVGDPGDEDVRCLIGQVSHLRDRALRRGLDEDAARWSEALAALRLDRLGL